jgi:hypothetical protein
VANNQPGLGYAQEFLIVGRLDEAVGRAQLSQVTWVRNLVLSQVRWARGRKADSEAALARLGSTGAELAAFQIAEARAYRGEKDPAFQWLERARRQRDPGRAWARSDFSPANLEDDPRRQGFLPELGLSDDAPIATSGTPRQEGIRRAHPDGARLTRRARRSTLPPP